MTGYDSGRVSPFRDPGFNGSWAPPPGFSQPYASFFAYQRQGIHLWLLLTCSYLSFLFPYSIVNFIRHAVMEDYVAI